MNRSNRTTLNIELFHINNVLICKGIILKTIEKKCNRYWYGDCAQRADTL